MTREEEDRKVEQLLAEIKTLRPWAVVDLMVRVTWHLNETGAADFCLEPSPRLQ